MILEPEEQRQVWDQAIETANSKVPSGRIVKATVAQLKQKPLVLNKDDCLIGDVFTLVSCYAFKLHCVGGRGAEGLQGQGREFDGFAEILDYAN